ncbi:MAG: hypothetical protein ACRCU6_04240 [Fusobacteriaceae bacterium]
MNVENLEILNKFEIETVKEAINYYYMMEFMLESQEINQDEEIGLAYTEDDDGIPKQISTIIEKKEIYVYEDNIKVKTFSMEKSEYIEFLDSVNFNDLINL